MTEIFKIKNHLQLIEERKHFDYTDIFISYMDLLERAGKAIKIDEAFLLFDMFIFYSQNKESILLRHETYDFIKFKAHLEELCEKNKTSFKTRELEEKALKKFIETLNVLKEHTSAFISSKDGKEYINGRSHLFLKNYSLRSVLFSMSEFTSEASKYNQDYSLLYKAETEETIKKYTQLFYASVEKKNVKRGEHTTVLVRVLPPEESEWYFYCKLSALSLYSQRAELLEIEKYQDNKDAEFTPSELELVSKFLTQELRCSSITLSKKLSKNELYQLKLSHKSNAYEPTKRTKTKELIEAVNNKFWFKNRSLEIDLYFISYASFLLFFFIAGKNFLFLDKINSQIYSLSLNATFHIILINIICFLHALKGFCDHNDSQYFKLWIKLCCSVIFLSFFKERELIELNGKSFYVKNNSYYLFDGNEKKLSKETFNKYMNYFCGIGGNSQLIERKVAPGNKIYCNIPKLSYSALIVKGAKK